MRIGPEFSVQARPESDRGVTKPDPSPTGIKLFMSEPDPSPTQLKSIFFHTNDTFMFVFMKAFITQLQRIWKCQQTDERNMREHVPLSQEYSC